jgi:hypothetical protein
MKFLFFFSFLLIGINVFAQSEGVKKNAKDSIAFIEDKTAKNEIGFDMFYFLNIFRQNFEGEQSSVFTFTYNRELTEKTVLRTTIGAGYTNYVTTANGIPPLKTSIVETIFREGIAWEKKSFRRWKLYYGADLEFQYGCNNFQQFTSANNSISENLSTTFMIGPGPFLGLILYINPRISFSIEGNMNFVYSNNTSKVNNPAHPELNSFNTTKGFTTTFITPQNIFLSVKF